MNHTTIVPVSAPVGLRQFDNSIAGNRYWNLTKKGVAYSEIRDQLQTFDLIYFRGAEPISNFIAWLEKKLAGPGAALYTHVGMVIRGSDFPYGSPYYARDKVYVFESTQSGRLGDGAKNVEARSKLGVQLRNLDLVAEFYDKNAQSYMAWGRLRDHLRPQHTSLLINQILRKYNGLHYDASLIDLSAALFRWLRPLRRFKNRCFDFFRSKNWQFCSELVANIYRDCGIIPGQVEPQNVLPCDFLENPLQPGQTYDTDRNQMPLLFCPGDPVRFTTRALN